MPRLDPGYLAYLKKNEVADIKISNNGWVWSVGNERHELYTAFGTVHVRKINE